MPVPELVAVLVYSVIHLRIMIFHNKLLVAYSKPVFELSR